MAKNYIVALVGRPNVGKSTLFNKIAGKRISIAHNVPGVTRDRVYAEVEWCGKPFTIIDTGGLEIKSEDTMWKHIRIQAEMAMDIADVIVLIADGKQGLLPDDYQIASFLRNRKKPVILAVNKLDNPEDNAYEYYELGFGEPYAISAEHSKGIGDLLDAVTQNFCKIHDAGEENKETLKIAVVGKPNAGKSSLVNKLLGFDRTIVTDIAGTTRDAIDTPFNYKGRDYILIDTAGIRRKRSVDEDVEYYSVVRAFAAIRRADVVLIVIDSTVEMTEQDVKIAGYVHEQGKPSLILMNKWDAIEKDTHTINVFNKMLDSNLKFMDYYCAVYISALSGQRVDKIISEVERIYINASRRITTGIINDVVNDLISINEPSAKGGRRLKIYYCTQVSVNPPSFVLFVNDAKLVHFSYKRYLENGIRKAFDFRGTPIRILIRNKDEDLIFDK